MQGSDNLPNAHTRANILGETKEGFQLELLAPGYAKDELKLNVEKDILTLSAGTKQSEMPEGQRYTRREFALPSFKRSFQLPEHTDVDNITAEHANGVLTVSIPKKVEVKAAVKEISIAWIRINGTCHPLGSFRSGCAFQSCRTGHEFRSIFFRSGVQH